MKPENPFRAGDRVIFKGTKRFPFLLTGNPFVPASFHWGAKNKATPTRGKGPAHGTVLCIWKKGWRHMVDVSFDQHGTYVVYHDELAFDVLDTLGAM